MKPVRLQFVEHLVQHRRIHDRVGFIASPIVKPAAYMQI